jgi:hypothetical protein
MELTMSHGRICYLEIPAKTSEASARFYSSIFGWKVRTRGDGEIAFDDPGGVSGTWVKESDRTPDEQTRIYIMVDTMNILLWVLQCLAALMYGASGVMKIFMFDNISQQVPSFGALPRQAWMALGIMELVCVVGLIVPSALRWQPRLTVVAATILAIESLVFIWVHVKYNEVGSLVMSGVLGLLMAFIAYGRMVLKPIV